MKASLSKLMYAAAKILYRRDEAAFALGLSVPAINRLLELKRYRTARFEGVLLIPAEEVFRMAAAIMESGAPSSASAEEKRAGGRFQPGERKIIRPEGPVTAETLWTINDVARRLHVSHGTVAKWLQHGKLEKTKAGNRTLIEEAALQAFVQASKKTRKQGKRGDSPPLSRI